MGARTLLTLSPLGLHDVPALELVGFQRLLAHGLKTNPVETARAIGTPDVLPCVGALVQGTRTPKDVLPRLVPALALELHRRGAVRGYRRSFRWSLPVAALADAAREGWIVGPVPYRGFRVGHERFELEDADGAWHPVDDLQVQRTLFQIPGLPTAHLSARDSNPVADVEDHPDKSGNDVDFGGRTPEVWTQGLSEAASLVHAVLPSLHAELGCALDRIIPVGFDAERHLSASYAEAPGTIYLTLHPDVLTLAEAIIHETQHGKINALAWFDTLLVNGHSERVRSPIRPDLRPLWGVLLAAHAFVPVSVLHCLLAESKHPLTASPGFRARQADVLAKNADALRTLRFHGRWTKNGAKLFGELSRMHELVVLRVEEEVLLPSYIAPTPDAQTNTRTSVDS